MDLNKNIIENAEMTEEQICFIQDLLNAHRPKKIVEIGVAAGGTSVAILEQLNKLALDYTMYSIDKSEMYYRDTTQKTGFLIDEYKLSGENNTNHKLYTGKYGVEWLDTIGNEIDFLILDTVHSLPGEIFDFLVFFPYLRDGAIVVVHDIILNHLSKTFKDGYVTQILLDSVVADKLTPIDVTKDYPGIGAFQINTDTKKYITDVFNALMITWSYIPEYAEYNLYHQKILSLYDEKQLFIFEQAYEMNKKTLSEIKEQKDNNFISLVRFLQQINYMKNHKIYIYGNGVVGKKIGLLIKSIGISDFKFIVSVKEMDEGIISLEEYLSDYYCKEDIIIIGVGPHLKRQIIDSLNGNNIENYYELEDDICNLLM